MTGSGLSRARRLLEGWSANLFQLALGIAQQVVLVPIFLYFWTSDAFAAWLAIYAAGNLILVADAGLQNSRDQSVSCVQIERRLRWPDRAVLCRYFAHLFRARRVARRLTADCYAAPASLRHIGIPRGRAF